MVDHEKFRELLESEIRRRKSERAILTELRKIKDVIKDARDLGVSHRKLVLFCREAGLRLTEHNMREFCRVVLKEPPLKRKKKKLKGPA